MAAKNWVVEVTVSGTEPDLYGPFTRETAERRRDMIRRQLDSLDDASDWSVTAWPLKRWEANVPRDIYLTARADLEEESAQWHDQMLGAGLIEDDD